MIRIGEQDIKADVICQHGRDGTIVPLKIRIVDDDGEYQTYQIRAYKVLAGNGKYTMPNGVSAINNIWKFECKIVVFNSEKIIQLLYNASDNYWRVME